MKVKDFMITEVISARQETTIKEVMKLFVEKNIGGVPIIDNEGKLAGIVTDGDILRAIKPIGPSIQNYFSFSMYFEGRDLEHGLDEVADREVMEIAKSKGIVTVTAEDEMSKVVLLLSKHHFKKLPVIDQSNRVVGVISRGDVIRNIQRTILNEWE